MKKVFFTFFILSFLFAACASSQAKTSTVGLPVPDELDTAIRETSDYLNKQLPQGNKLVILNIQSEFPALSEYIIDELIANTVNDRIFSVVDRNQLNTIRAELDFQMSGEVDDQTAQALGRMAGAQIIVSGAVSQIGDLYRMRIRALSVESAQIAGQFNRNIPDGPTVAALAKSRATGYGDASPRSPATPSSASTAQTAPVNSSPVTTPVQAIPAQATVPTPAPVPAPAAPPAPVIYKVGERGPAGGWIFHDKGVFTNGWQYLEAAPNDIGPTQWGASGTEVSGNNSAVGTGKANTQRIVAVLEQHGDDGAAILCAALSINGYKDWFLPSQDELDLMYKNLKQKGIGNFGNGWYWSSSQSNARHIQATAQQFSDGHSNRHGKDNSFSIRAIRAF